MELIQAIKERRSVRKFSDKALSYDTIKELIETSIYAPNARGLEPWTFLVIQGKEEMKKISDAAKAYALTLLETNPGLRQFEKWFRDPEKNIFYEAENMVVIFGDKVSPWYMVDCSCAAENLMLLAHSQGIGTCWIGLCAPYFNQPEVKKAYGIPDNHELVAPIIMGYMEEDRKPLIAKRKEPRIIRH